MAPPSKATSAQVDILYRGHNVPTRAEVVTCPDQLRDLLPADRFVFVRNCVDGEVVISACSMELIQEIRIAT